MCECSFCSKCILKWAEKDSRCPACRGRFRSVTEKMLDREQPGLGCTDDEEMKHSKQMLGKAIKIHDIPERNQVVVQMLSVEAQCGRQKNSVSQVSTVAILSPAWVHTCCRMC